MLLDQKTQDLLSRAFKDAHSGKTVSVGAIDFNNDTVIAAVFRAAMMPDLNDGIAALIIKEKIEAGQVKQLKRLANALKENRPEKPVGTQTFIRACDVYEILENGGDSGIAKLLKKAKDQLELARAATDHRYAAECRGIRQAYDTAYSTLMKDLEDRGIIKPPPAP